MAKTPATPRRKGAKAGPETEEPLRSNWRTPPAQPRRKVRQYTAVTDGTSGRKGAAPRKARPQVQALSRQELLRFGRVLALVALVIVVAIGMYQLLHLPQLAITGSSTQIGGVQRTPPHRVFEASATDGRNIFVLRASDIQSRVLALPGIARVDVHLRLPNHLIIDVVEHAPLVVWQGITTTVWLAQDAAEVPQAGDLPPLTLKDETGAALAQSQTLWPLVLKNLAELHAAEPQIRELFYGKTEGLYYRSVEGWQVWLGDSGPIPAKLALVRAAQQEIARQGVRPQVIDVRQSGQRALYW